LDRIKRLSKTRTGLILAQGFFAPFALRMPFVEHTGLPFKTMATDGRFIYYDPGYVDSCNDEELLFTVAHEGLHPAFLHHLREGKRDHDRWNQACDFAINLILVKAKLKPPPNICLDWQFDGMSAEQIYNDLPEDFMPKGGWNIGGVLPFKAENGEEATPEQKKVHEQEWITEFVSAAQTAKAIGTLPGDMDRYINDMLKPVINWKAVLQRFLTATVRNDYNWNRPNRRYINQGMYLPHLQSPALGNGVVFMDTSCSVGADDLNKLGAETKGVTDSYKVDLDVIYVDTRVAGHDKVEAINPYFKLEPKGGGGTDFRPGFEYLEKEGITPKFGLYLTDGDCNSFPDVPPSFPLIWVLTEQNRYFDPPFGQTLIMPKARRSYDS
jgi:predicted metal-dependent peptidase